jgi:hypothetical protein
MRYRSIVAVAIGVVTMLAAMRTLAQVKPPQPFFKATQDCEAPQRISGLNPGQVRLVMDRVYRAIGLNRTAGTHVLLQVPEAQPAQRWVALSCGEFAASGPPEPTPSPPSTGVFFDEVDNPIPVPNSNQPQDITPPPPAIVRFDSRVLALCGPGFNAPVDRQAFQQLLRDYPDVQQKLQQAVRGSLRPGRTSAEAFLQDLTDVWFERDGFKHIFCGEADTKPDLEIGGLHFHRRYWQLQEVRLAERIDRTSSGKEAAREVVPGVIYTFGVRINTPGNPLEHWIKGYAYVLDAQEILLHGTTAYKQFRGSGACLYPIQDRTVAPFAVEPVQFKAVVVKDGAALVTFYPDATPDTGTPVCR